MNGTVFPAFHGPHCKPQLQQGWAQASNPGCLWAPPWDTQSLSEQVVPVLGSLCCQSHPSPWGLRCSDPPQHSRNSACALQGSDPVAEMEQIFLHSLVEGWLCESLSCSCCSHSCQVQKGLSQLACSGPLWTWFGSNTCWLLILEPEYEIVQIQA